MDSGRPRAGRTPPHAGDVHHLAHADRGRTGPLLRHRTQSPLRGTAMRRFVRDHSLSLFFLAIFIAALVGQAIAGHILHNEEAIAHDGQEMSFWRYLVSSEFGNAVMENWQSEYLQFMLFMLATVWLLQRGSPESKELDKAGRESKKDQRLEEHATEDSPLWARVGG